MSNPGDEGILVTTEISTEIRFDINELSQIPVDHSPWVLCLVPADHICREYSDWDCVESLPGISVLRETYDRKFFKVAVTESYIPWLKQHHFEFEIDRYYDWTRPTESEVNVYGKLIAGRKSEQRFLRIATEAIWCKSSPGLESFYRGVTPSELRIALELAILNHDILEAPTHVRTKFAQSLVVLRLKLLGDYSSPPVLRLLDKSESDLLDIFRKDYTDLFKPGSAFTNSTVEYHRIALIRCLVVDCGGKKDQEQCRFDWRHTPHDNLSYYGSLVDLAGSNVLRNFNSHAIPEQTSKSKACINENLRPLNVREWDAHLSACLPICRSSEHPNVPTKIINGLGIDQTDEIRFQRERLYYRRPLLKRADNDILVLLVWTSMIQDLCPRMISEWAVSDHGQTVYQRMLEEIQISRSPEQLALTLTALLCYLRLLPSPSKDVSQSINGCYLEDFNAAMDGHHLGNEMMVLERTLRSFEQAARENGHDPREFLPSILTIDCSVLECPERFLDEYWVTPAFVENKNPAPHIRNRNVKFGSTEAISDDLAMCALVFDLLSIFAIIQVHYWAIGHPEILVSTQPLLPVAEVHEKKQNVQTWEDSREQPLPVVDNSKPEHPYLGPSAVVKFKSECDIKQYRFIRLSNLQGPDLAQKISSIRNLSEVFSLVELPDESWEIVVLIADSPTLENKLSQMFPGCNIDTEHDPFQPSSGDVESFCIETGSSSIRPLSKSADPSYLKAQALKRNLFLETITAMSTQDPKKAIFYACWYERYWGSEAGILV
ncbi:hypothetical protein UCRPC4_g03198 [Phaeomoniella chlamydospora]|uniref:Uncharacterized protein n=1 Tax=Phaeomoniella chlamydospora TaxID=158046 RepID=A0A0G2H1L7_PHACM|nr:hypothetical protein UCRPC4_g03198 [Phaeomoniella chlamydospora]